MICTNNLLIVEHNLEQRSSTIHLYLQLHQSVWFPKMTLTECSLIPKSGDRTAAKQSPSQCPGSFCTTWRPTDCPQEVVSDGLGLLLAEPSLLLIEKVMISRTHFTLSKKMYQVKVRDSKRYVSVHNWIRFKTKISLNGKLTIPSGKSKSRNWGPCNEKIWWVRYWGRFKEHEGVWSVSNRQRSKAVEGLQKSWGIQVCGKSTLGQTGQTAGKIPVCTDKLWQCI